MATIRNPQQVEPESCEDAEIGRGAHDMEGYHSRLSSENGKSCCQQWKARTARRGGILPITGGCLNPSADVLRTERETQPGLPPVDKGRMDRTAASDVIGLAPRSHSTLKVGQLPTCGEGL